MKTKHILIGLAAVAVVGGAYWYFTKDKKEDASKDKDASAKKDSASAEKKSNCSGDGYSNIVKEFKMDKGISACPSGCMQNSAKRTCRCNVE